jgi:hypothetical protein
MARGSAKDFLTRVNSVSANALPDREQKLVRGR